MKIQSPKIAEPTLEERVVILEEKYSQVLNEFEELKLSMNRTLAEQRDEIVKLREALRLERRDRCIRQQNALKLFKSE